MPETIPKKYRDLVGTKKQFTGYLFNRKENFLKPTEFSVLKIRPGSAIIMNLKTMNEKHPTFELLLKRPEMRKAKWTKPFPIREINLSKE